MPELEDFHRHHHRRPCRTSSYTFSLLSLGQRFFFRVMLLLLLFESDESCSTKVSLKRERGSEREGGNERNNKYIQFEEKISGKD